MVPAALLMSTNLSVSSAFITFKQNLKKQAPNAQKFNRVFQGLAYQQVRLNILKQESNTPIQTCSKSSIDKL